MVHEENNDGSGDNQDNTDGNSKKAEDVKTEILSNLKSMMPGESLGIGCSSFINLDFLSGRRSFVNGAGSRNMVDDNSEVGSGDTQDDPDPNRKKADDAKEKILSHVKSIMPGESHGEWYFSYIELALSWVNDYS